MKTKENVKHVQTDSSGQKYSRYNSVTTVLFIYVIYLFSQIYKKIIMTVN